MFPLLHIFETFYENAFNEGRYRNLYAMIYMYMWYKQTFWGYAPLMINYRQAYIFLDIIVRYSILL